MIFIKAKPGRVEEVAFAGESPAERAIEGCTLAGDSQGAPKDRKVSSAFPHGFRFSPNGRLSP